VNNFWSRIFTGALFVVTVAGSVIYSHILFSLLFLGISLWTLYEFQRMTGVATGHFYIRHGAGLAAALVVYATMALVSLQWAEPRVMLVNLLVLPLLLTSELYYKSPTPFRNVALNFFGIFYIVIPFALLSFFFNPTLASTGDQPFVLLGFFILLWVYDSFAYLFGVWLGKHRLFARHSPKKSWEGLIGGFLAGFAAAFIIAGFWNILPLLHWIIIAALIMIFGTFGDLAESMLKRSIKVKDSGSVLPGHGGMLDRFDATLLAAPAVFIYLMLFFP
jgi:phosphatidate cytidylyltransferase